MILQRSATIRAVLALLTALWVLPSVGSAQRAPAERSPGELAAEIHRRGDYPDHLDVRGSDGQVQSVPGAAGGRLRQNLQDMVRGGAESRRESEVPEAEEDSGFEFPDLNFGAAGEWMGIAALVLLLTALAGGVVVMLLSLRGRRHETPKAKASPTNPSTPRPGRQGLDPDALAAEGRFREAIAALVLSALRTGGWPNVASDTLREALTQISPKDPRLPGFGALVRGAEQARYGTTAPTKELYLQLRRTWAQLQDPRSNADG